ncbi:unnamed protein product [Polarella glacialis]|uniref:Uncharacterized protein n=1 Tax=Polarella glacialis TaxID=89957 RepID=A0A813FPL3_POLGL|nr:unnamed protein product [Polarella glacialis]
MVLKTLSELSPFRKSAFGQGSRSGARDGALGSHGNRSKAAALRPPPRPSPRNAAAAGSSEQRPSTNARPLPNVIPLPSRGLSPPERRSPPPPSGSLVPSSASHGPALPDVTSS